MGLRLCTAQECCSLELGAEQGTQGGRGAEQLCLQYRKCPVCRGTLLPPSCALPVATPSQWVQGTPGRTLGWVLGTGGAGQEQEARGTATAKEKRDLGVGNKGYKSCKRGLIPVLGWLMLRCPGCPILGCRSLFWKREKLLVESQGQ